MPSFVEPDSPIEDSIAAGPLIPCLASGNDSRGTMGAEVPLRTDFSACELRQLAKRADADQARRLLSLAAGLDGLSRKAAAEIGAVGRQRLRDWAHRFNAKGLEGLINGKAPGLVPKLSAEQKQELRRSAEAGPDPARGGVMRWGCVDLRRVIKERFDVDLDEVSIGPTLKELGFAHVSSRPQNPKQHPQATEAFEKNFPEHVAEAIAGKGIATGAPVEVCFQDEMRVGQKNGPVYQRA